MVINNGIKLYWREVGRRANSMGIYSSLWIRERSMEDTDVISLCDSGKTKQQEGRRHRRRSGHIYNLC